MARVTRREVGETGVENQSASRPSGPTRYLWKFQRGLAKNPSSRAAHLKKGCAFLPLTRTLAVMGKRTLKFASQKLLICASVPGS